MKKALLFLLLIFLISSFSSVVKQMEDKEVSSQPHLSQNYNPGETTKGDTRYSQDVLNERIDTESSEPSSVNNEKEDLLNHIKELIDAYTDSTYYQDEKNNNADSVEPYSLSYVPKAGSLIAFLELYFSHFVLNPIVISIILIAFCGVLISIMRKENYAYAFLRSLNGFLLYSLLKLLGCNQSLSFIFGLVSTICPILLFSGFYFFFNKENNT